MQDKTVILQAAFNTVTTLINDIQKYSTITFSPKFARELNDVTKSLASYINELEAEARAQQEDAKQESPSDG